MTALVRRGKSKPEAASPWLVALLAPKPTRVVTVAIANKAARVQGRCPHDRCAHTFMSAICIAATVIFWLNQ